VDGSEIAVVASINIITVVSVIYYLKGKVEAMERSTNQRFEDLKEYINERLNDFYKMFNTRIKNIEEIVFRDDD